MRLQISRFRFVRVKAVCHTTELSLNRSGDISNTMSSQKNSKWMNVSRTWMKLNSSL